MNCVQLLMQCKSLKFLRLYFESDLIQNISPDTFKADPGIRGLRSVRGIERVEIWNLGYEPLGLYGPVKWLKEEMETSDEEWEHENSLASKNVDNGLE